MVNRARESPGRHLLDDLWWEAVGPPESEADEAEGFVTLGGQSLGAARIVATVREELGVELPLTLLLRDNACLADLRRLAEAAPAGLAAAPPAGGDIDQVGYRSPLAPSQHRLWVLSRLHPESAAYNVVSALGLRGAVDGDALRAAVADVVGRHDALRARVVDDPLELHYGHVGEVPFQLVETDRELTPPVVDEFVHGVAEATIALDTAPLMRAALLRSTAPGERGQACLALSLHHIIADQASADLVVRDLFDAYAVRRDGTSPDFPPAPSFAAHAAAEAGLVGGAAWRADLRFWRDLLGAVPPPPPLPFTSAGPPTPSHKGADHEVDLGADRSARIQRFLREHAFTPAVLFVGCLAVVLTRWAGTGRGVIGMPASRRRSKNDHQMVGFLVETLPLLVDVDRQPDLLGVLRHARDRYLNAITHSHPTFDAIVRELDPPARALENPLFRVWFNDLTQGAVMPRPTGLEVRPLRVSGTAALFDANLYLRRDDEGFRLQLIRRVERVPAPMARELLDQCLLVLDQVLRDPSVPPSSVPLTGAARAAVTPPAEAEPVAPVGATTWSPRRALSVGPSGVALVAPDGTLSYPDLDAAVTTLADRLSAAGVEPGGVVEIRGARAFGLPVALLATWRVGGVAALVDGTLPAGRRNEQRKLLSPVAVLSVPENGTEPMLSAGDPDPRIVPDASHILFTSGSGGGPAAVLVGAEPLAAALRWYAATFTPTAADRFVLVAGLGHDPVLRDLLVPLSVGASVAIPPAAVLADPAALLRLLVDRRITVLHATPALLQLLVVAWRAEPALRLADLRLVLSGGAPLPTGLVRQLREMTDAAVVNGYGTTETPQLAACHLVLGPGAPCDDLGDSPDEAPLPLGRGVAGAELRVRTDQGRDAGVGELGEIVVVGPGLASGYLAGSGGPERFGTDERGRPAFRTGDLGRVDPDGLVHFAGRRDRQIDLDGHRLNLAEVEAAALSATTVAQAVAGVVSTKVGQSLALQVVPAAGARVDPRALRSQLLTLLPAWGVPTLISVRDRLTSTANHKVRFETSELAEGSELAAGSELAEGKVGRQDGASADVHDTERWVVGLLAEIVGRPVDPDEHFFEAGLTSMQLLRLHGLLAQRTTEAPPATALFAHPTAREIARLLSGGTPAAEPGVPLRRGGSAASAAERRRAIRTQLSHEREGSSGDGH